MTNIFLMSNSMFCPNCGMLKSNCTCKKSTKKKSEGPTNLFSFSKKITSSVLDDEIPEVYSVDNHKLDEGTSAYLKELYPHIDEDIIIENATSIEMDLESGDVGIEDTLYDYFTGSRSTCHWSQNPMKAARKLATCHDGSVSPNGRCDLNCLTHLSQWRQPDISST